LGWLLPGSLHQPQAWADAPAEQILLFNMGQRLNLAKRSQAASVPWGLPARSGSLLGAFPRPPPAAVAQAYTSLVHAAVERFYLRMSCSSVGLQRNCKHGT